MTSSQRRLLVVSCLAATGCPGLGWLYRAAELLAVVLARALLGLRYAELTVLAGKDATTEAFVDRIGSLTSARGVVAVDVLLHLHGRPGELTFADGAVATEELSQSLRSRARPGRLRLLYSTACYGASHAPDFVAAGFQAASGSLGTNANGVYDYGVQLALWALSLPYARALDAGNLRLPLRLFDSAARSLGFAEVDSRKVVCGDPSTSISARRSGGITQR